MSLYEKEAQKDTDENLRYAHEDGEGKSIRKFLVGSTDVLYIYVLE